MLRNRAPFDPPTVGSRIRLAGLSAVCHPLRAANAAARAAGLRPRASLRALLYHDIPREHEATFAAQLRWLARDWRFVTADQFAEMQLGHSPVRKRSLLLTFDDGFLSNRRVAESILRPMGISALFFVVTEFIDIDDAAQERNFLATRIWPGGDPARLPASWRSMSWEDVGALVEQGHTIGAHTRTHALLSDVLTRADLEREIVGAGDYLASRINARVDHFAFPFGRMRSISPAALAIAARRYRLIHSGIRGDNAAHPGIIVKRDWIGSGDPVLVAGAFLEGAVDRLHAGEAGALGDWGRAAIP